MFIDNLIERFGVKEEFFDVELPDGSKLKFKHLTDYAEIKAVQNGAVAFTKQMQEAKNLVGELKENHTDCAETLASAYVLHATLVEPKVTQAEFLKLAKRCGPIYNAIVTQYNHAETRHILTVELEEVEELKND